ncbi:MAG: ribonuclease HII [Candidatus Pacebacteria bacterium]|nr:ribonuclease HII [Candidatus Paceibacterota bacterium]
MANLNLERRLLKQYTTIMGIDEAGRGPLAGPVVAAAVSLNSLNNKKLKKIVSLAKDSKKMTARQREKVFEMILKEKTLKWGIGEASNIAIDRINILNATKLAMKKAVFKIKKNLKHTILIIDGNQRINIDCDQVAIINGDEKIFLCSCASIIAKVYRDRLMERLDKKYPKYGFKQHKGYPTKKHYASIRKNGLSPMHRKSFNCG